MLARCSREFRACLDLDIGGELLQHVIEQGDLVVRIAARACREQIGDPLNDPQALVDAADRSGRDQFIEHRTALRERIGIL